MYLIKTKDVKSVKLQNLKVDDNFIFLEERKFLGKVIRKEGFYQRVLGSISVRYEGPFSKQQLEKSYIVTDNLVFKYATVVVETYSNDTLSGRFLSMDIAEKAVQRLMKVVFEAKEGDFIDIDKIFYESEGNR